MEKIVMQVVLLSLFLHVLKSASQESGWLNIDCGSEQSAVVRSLQWWTDANFTKTGFNKRLPQGRALEEMSTLRFFPDQAREHCYSIPSTSPWPYMVRAGFYYGNYDGLFIPPTFDLKIDGQYWTTVNTSSSMNDGAPVYRETIYVPRGYAFEVCLKQTRQGEVPFISSLETMILGDDLYGSMVPLSFDPPNAAFHLVTRINFGGPEVRFGGGYYDDYYNRIWTSGAAPENCLNVSSPPVAFDSYDNYPPMGVLNDSISAAKASDPIILTVDLPALDGPHPAYFIFYFSFPNGTFGLRATQIYINGQMQSTVTFGWLGTQVVTIYAEDVAAPTINVTLTPGPTCNLSTMISGMEVFTRHALTPAPPPPHYSFGQPPPPCAARAPLFYFRHVVLAVASCLAAVV